MQDHVWESSTGLSRPNSTRHSPGFAFTVRLLVTSRVTGLGDGTSLGNSTRLSRGTSAPYTPAASYSSTYSPATPSSYWPPPPMTDQELLQRAITIVRNSRRVANAAYELNYNARQLVRVLHDRANDGEAGPSAPADVQRRHGSHGTDDSHSHSSARRSHSRSRGD